MSTLGFTPLSASEMLAPLLAIVALTVTPGCTRRDVPLSAAPAGAVLEKPAPAASAPAPPRSAPGASIYGLPVQLTDDAGATRTLDSFRGQPLLITMFYGGCKAACPRLISDLKQLERQIPAPVRSELRVLMVSFDPQRDTPEALSKLKRESAMDAARWTLASTTDGDARELAGVLGIRYRRLDSDEFFHTSAIILLDAEGRPRARVEGLGGDTAQVLAEVARP